MKIDAAKKEFVQTWGKLGSNWGISRTMAQIHALLMIAHEPMSTEEVMEDLNISRGNANMNLRALMDWGLVKKELRAGERKEFFLAEKDMWRVFRQIAKERRKRELEPILHALEEMQKIEPTAGRKQEEKAFTETVDGIYRFASKADKSLDTLIRADENWFLGTVMKLMK
jgi:DNA-binding transcriptional regulator GbsR (MarR family)